MADPVQKVTVIMKRLALIFAFLAFSRASFADVLAETPAVEKSVAKEEAPMAIAVNSPLSWIGGTSVAGSAYVRVTSHHAVRLNVASYAAGAMAESFVGAVTESEASYDGRILDVSAGWMYFPRRTWDGATLEIGLLNRNSETSERDEFSANELVERDTQLYAARALVGWSWHIADSAMIAFAVGMSSGYQTGTETDTMSVGTTAPVTRDVSGWKTGFEGYLRFGFTLGN